MTYVVLKDDKQSQADRFLLHRFIRPVPFYWLCVVAFIYLSNLGLLNLSRTLPMLSDLVTNDWLGVLRYMASGLNLTSHYSAQEIVKTLLFIPYKDVNGDYHPILGVGWTLNLEVFIYVIFALTLLGKKAQAPFITASIITTFWMAGTLTDKFNASYLGFYANDYTPYFSLGIVNYYSWRRLECIAPKKILIGFSLFLIGLYISTQLGLPYVYPFALGALLLHSTGKRIEHPLPLLLGATSYSLYLIHTIILEMIRTLHYDIPVFRYNSNIASSIFAVLVCILASIIIHFSLEKPIVKTLRVKCLPILDRS